MTSSITGRLRFVLIGAGNLGSAVSIKLLNAGINPVRIINRSVGKAKELAKNTGCKNYSTNLTALPDCDFILIATNDDSIPDIIRDLKGVNKPVFHCSGSTPVSVFNNLISKFGVLYPLQSFSKGRHPDLNEVPVLIEASDDQTLNLLRSIAESLSNVVYMVNSRDRMKVHIAAVFASNFTNHFYSIAEKINEENGLPGNMLAPLIRETCEKAIIHGGSNSQTGPAYREDEKVIEKHQESLRDNMQLQNLYTFVSNSIINSKKEKQGKH